MATSGTLDASNNFSLLPLAPTSPELKPTQDGWQDFRSNSLPNRMFAFEDHIVDHYRHALNNLVEQPCPLCTLFAETGILMGLLYHCGGPRFLGADPDGRNVNKGQGSQVSVSPHCLLARRLWVRSPFSNATPLLYGAFTMRHFALACDYDGTIAHDGAVDEPTVRALERLRASSRHIILVTGREVSDLCRILPCIRLFDRVVAENGGLIYTPETHEQRELTKPPPERFVSRLRELRVHPLVVGYTIVATLSANEDKVSQAIKELGLQVRITHNKGNIMILPTGVTKGTGLRAALEELALLPRDCIAVGDAENDIAMLKICGLAVAVANALPRVKRHARLVMARARGAGVAELVDWLLATDH